MEQASFLEADGLTPINEQKDACADQTLIWADSDYIGQARSWKQGGFQFIKWTAEGAQNENFFSMLQRVGLRQGPGVC